MNRQFICNVELTKAAQVDLIWFLGIWAKRKFDANNERGRYFLKILLCLADGYIPEEDLEYFIMGTSIRAIDSYENSLGIAEEIYLKDNSYVINRINSFRVEVVDQVRPVTSLPLLRMINSYKESIGSDIIDESIVKGR